MGGDSWTVNVGPVDDDLSMSAGPSYRHIIGKIKDDNTLHTIHHVTGEIDLNNFNNSKIIHPIGQNGDPFSKFYDNYLDMWQQVEYIDMKTVDYNSLYLMTYTP